jgi:hypothetical protein
LPISPALNAEMRCLIHSHSDPVRVSSMGCSNYLSISLLTLRDSWETYQFSKVVNCLS